MANLSSTQDRIGFEIVNNNLELIFPSFMKENENDINKSTSEKVKYFRLFKKYNEYSKEIKEESLYKSQKMNNEEYNYSVFEAYYLLLMDFMDLGPFIFTEIETNKKQRGRVNWNKTINKSILTISGENLIYNTPYYKNTNILYNHPLTILYGIYLLQIESSTGIKMNLASQYKNIIENNKRNININEVLDNLKSSMFSDRERKVFGILNAINSNNKKLDKVASNANLHYVENINNLWEHILKKVIGDEYNNFKELFAKGTYNLNVEENVYTRSGLRMIPDIIKEYKGKLYIIDAKNYLPHINNNIPGSGDINKQILYRYFLSKEYNENNKYWIKDIVNIFLLPNDLQGEVIKEVGMHRLTNSDMGNIFLYQVDFDSVVNAYINNDYKTKDIILETLSYDK